jgi:hypothetical protein
VTELRRNREADPSYPPVLFVFRDVLERGQKYFDRFWPEARAIADETGEIFRGFELQRGSLLELFGPGVFSAAWRAFRKGHFIGLPGRAPLLRAGLFLVEDAEILWHHDFEHIGDHPDFRHLPQLAVK